MHFSRYRAVLLLAAGCVGCSSTNPPDTQKELPASSNQAPNGDEAILAKWEAFVGKVRSHEDRKLRESEAKKVLWTPGTTVDVRGDLRKTDSLTSPYRGEIIVFYNVPSGFSYKWTYTFTRDGNQWRPVNGVQEHTDKRGASDGKVTKKDLSISRVQEIVAEWLR